MRILITGRGTSGSWCVRGEQLGRAIGAAAIPNALDVAGYSAAVVVKRAGVALARLQRADVPIVWDVVDAWPQPTGNDWDRSDCMDWLREQVRSIRPAAIVAATQAMALDCAEFGLPVLALPHHARPGIAANPIREAVRTVGYEGSVDHLGSWRPRLEAACARRGWQFVVNPPNLADVDIVVALRERCGYAAMHWKSNVKLANAQASGTPCVLAPESGYLETESGCERWAVDMCHVERAFDELESVATRRHVSGELLAAAPLLPSIAKTYLAWLKTILT